MFLVLRQGLNSISPGCSGLAVFHGLCNLIKWPRGLLVAHWAFLMQGVMVFTNPTFSPPFQSLCLFFLLLLLQNFGTLVILTRKTENKCHCPDYGLTVWLTIKYEVYRFCCLVSWDTVFIFRSDCLELDFISGWSPTHIPSVSVLGCRDYRIVSPCPGSNVFIDSFTWWIKFTSILVFRNCLLYVDGCWSWSYASYIWCNNHQIFFHSVHWLVNYIVQFGNIELTLHFHNKPFW